MFNKCSNLTSFTSDLSNLTNGEYMFYDCKLDADSVSNIALTINRHSGSRIDLGIESLIESSTKVQKDVGLIKHKGWDVYVNGNNGSSHYELPVYAGYQSAEEIESVGTYIVKGAWTEHLPDLVNGYRLFFTNTNLTSFSGDLSLLEDGSEMFYGCQNLTSFSSSLPSLTNGDKMFAYCKLDTASVQHIADTINACNGTIDIGIANSKPNGKETVAFRKMAAKGWTVRVNNSLVFQPKTA